ncbi:hypothetical protein DDT91_04385 [Algoriphagus sp. AK58]|nr:hypothetical protein [Algoriphagus sp. AK58]
MCLFLAVSAIYRIESGPRLTSLPKKQRLSEVFCVLKWSEKFRDGSFHASSFENPHLWSRSFFTGFAELSKPLFALIQMERRAKSSSLIYTF